MIDIMNCINKFDLFSIKSNLVTDYSIFLCGPGLLFFYPKRSFYCISLTKKNNNNFCVNCVKF